MKKEDRLPDVGDIIMSEKFAFGHYNDEKEKDVIYISSEQGDHRYTTGIDEDERVRLAAKTGKIPPKTRVVNLGAYDKSRKIAKFVVEEARMQGGDSDPRDYYPDGWHVAARRLNGDGSYDPKGEVICFYMSGCFMGMVEPKDVKIVGRMQKRFV